MARLPNPAALVRFPVRQRLAYIEEVLFWRGRVCRRDLQERFGISNQKAALDFAAYNRIAPGRIAYDASLKRYLATPRFNPAFYSPDAPSALTSWATVETVPALARPLNATALRALVIAAHEGLQCRVRYRSMHSGTFSWRTVSPHAFAFNGERWHARVYDHTTAKWCDLVLGRVEASEVREAPGEPASADREWVTMAKLTFRVNRSLLTQQQLTLLRDFGAQRGVITLQVRRAMIFYVAARLGILRYPIGWLLARTETRQLLRQLRMPGYI